MINSMKQEQEQDHQMTSSLDEESECFKGASLPTKPELVASDNSTDNNARLRAMQTVLRDGGGNMRLPFAYKLHIMLDDMEKIGRGTEIISWVEEGKAFKIHKPKKFEQEIQPLYFRQSKLTSFVRQCYMYGFAKLDSGKSKGAYIHADFQRGKIANTLSIERRSSTRDHGDKAIQHFPVKENKPTAVRTAPATTSTTSAAPPEGIRNEYAIPLTGTYPLTMGEDVAAASMIEDVSHTRLSAFETVKCESDWTLNPVICNSSILQPSQESADSANWVTVLEESFLANALLDTGDCWDGSNQSPFEPRPIDLTRTHVFDHQNGFAG